MYHYNILSYIYYIYIYHIYIYPLYISNKIVIISMNSFMFSNYITSIITETDRLKLGDFMDLDKIYRS